MRRIRGGGHCAIRLLQPSGVTRNCVWFFYWGGGGGSYRASVK